MNKEKRPSVPGVPDIVAAVYGNGRTEARIRGTRDVIAEAPDNRGLIMQLKQKYPAGFSIEFRDDPHM